MSANFIGLYDYECRLLHLSGHAPGVPYDNAAFIGRRVWDFVPDDKAGYVEELFRRIFEPDITEVVYAFIWGPGGGLPDHVYIQRLEWAGLSETAFVGQLWEFPHELAKLTRAEREVVFRTGRGETPRDIADDSGVALRTTHTHLANAREKLSLEPGEFVIFASRYTRAIDAIKTLEQMTHIGL